MQAVCPPDMMNHLNQMQGLINSLPKSTSNPTQNVDSDDKEKCSKMELDEANTKIDLLKSQNNDLELKIKILIEEKNQAMDDIQNLKKEIENMKQ